MKAIAKAILDLPKPEGTTYKERGSLLSLPTMYWASANYLLLGFITASFSAKKKMGLSPSASSRFMVS
jgi:hypothetical protein